MAAPRSTSRTPPAAGHGRSTRLPAGHSGVRHRLPVPPARMRACPQPTRRSPATTIRPAGGHVEPGEDPWTTVVRECHEELGIQAQASPITGEFPLFLTVTQTRGQGTHTDVSLWYLLDAGADTITSYDEDEFDAIRWLTSEQVLEESHELLDPHMHRFTHKLQRAQAGRHSR